MTFTEIWLRLMAVMTLNGEQMLKAARYLLRYAQNPSDICRYSAMSAVQKTAFLSVKQQDLELASEWLDQPKHYLVTAESPLYPAQLRAIEDFPGALLVAGNVEALNSTQLAVVGSRNQSWYGEHWGRVITEELAVRGLTITSGLALGVDGVAHRAALTVKGTTIAVPGSGFYQPYPKRHRCLAEQIVDEDGALVSEFPLNTAPWPGNFPRRNRIISGLSVGTFVVEATLRSGSLITARCALEQGREVFALPGPINNPGCDGTHALIRQGAVLVTKSTDIFEYLNSELHWLQSDEKLENNSADREALSLPFYELLANVGYEVTPVDVVADRAGQPVPVIVATLLELELAGWIAAVPGGYVRLRRAGHVRRTDVLI